MHSYRIPSQGFAYDASDLRSSPASGPHTPVSNQKSPAIDVNSLAAYDPMAYDFLGLSVTRREERSALPALNAVGWPITNVAGPRRNAASPESSPLRCADLTTNQLAVFEKILESMRSRPDSANNSPFAALRPVEIVANNSSAFLPEPLVPPMPANQFLGLTTDDQLHLQQTRLQLLQDDHLQLQQAREAQTCQEEAQLIATQWLERLVDCEEKEESRSQAPPNRWQVQCQVSQDYLDRSLESDEESELLALISEEDSQEEEMPTDESMQWKFGRASAAFLARRAAILGDEDVASSSGCSRRSSKRPALAAVPGSPDFAPQLAVATAAQQQDFRRFQERNVMDMSAESIDEWLFSSMMGEKKTAEKRH